MLINAYLVRIEDDAIAPILVSLDSIDITDLHTQLLWLAAQGIRAPLVQAVIVCDTSN